MLPEGWTKEQVKDRGEVQAGRQRSPSFLEGELTKYLRVANVFDGYIDTSDVLEMPFTSEERNRYLLRDGDLLLNEGQSLALVGRPALYLGRPAECCFQNTLIRFRPDSRTCPHFALQKFRLCLYDGTFQAIATQTTSIAHLGVSRFATLKLSWPSLIDQRRIVQVLAAWDDAIAASDQLLANGRKQKQAFQSVILSGKRRLERRCPEVAQISTPHGSIPGDPRIGSIAHEVSQKHSSGQVYPVLSCTKHAGLVDSLSYFKKQVFSKDLSTYKVVPDGCFVYATNHIEEGSIGYQDLHDFGLVSPMYTVFKTAEDVHDGYLYRLLKTEHFRQIFAAATNSSVDRRGSLRWSDFKKLHVPLPPMEEQVAITDLLDMADREIALLEKKLASFRIEKVALMQQLLTGKRRVPAPKIAEATSA